MFDIDELYEICLSSGSEPAITARRVYDFVRSPFKIWCDLNAPEEEKDPLSEYGRFLLEQGQQHEEKTVIAAYPEMKKISYITPEEGFRIVLESMRDGIKAMHNMPIFYLPEGLVGRVDIFERKDDHPSKFGNYHYIIKEIKLAKNLKKYHLIQTAYYNYMLGKIQGYTPPFYSLINRDRDEFRCKYNEAEVLKVLTGIREIYNGKEVSATFNSCIWPWETYCNQEAIKRQDISLVGGIGASFKEKLVKTGFTRVSNLATAKISELTKIKGIGHKRAQRFQRCATAIVNGTHIKLVNTSFPTVSTEIFLDLEGTGEQVSEEELVSIDYLIGVLIRKNGNEEYISFLAKDLQSEEQMFKEFLEWFTNQDDYIIYHWHNYEKVHLERLAKRYGIPLKIKARLFGSLRDLYKDATSSFVFPTYGNGLKTVANYMGFCWRDKEIGALESIALYFQYLQNPENNRGKLERIIKYNEDDCIATKIVKDWLFTH